MMWSTAVAERKDMAALQLPADQHLAGDINSVHLED